MVGCTLELIRQQWEAFMKDYSEVVFRLSHHRAVLLAACEQASTLLDALRMDHGVGDLLAPGHEELYQAVDEQIKAAIAAATG